MSKPDADPEAVGRSIVLRRLSTAPQTRAQLDDAMARRGVPSDVRDRILSRFSDLGFVDDRAFAQLWVDSRHVGRGLGRRALGFELRRRGVAAGVVEEALGQLSPDQEEQTARAWVARRLPATRRLDRQTRLRRLTAMLARKGYPAGMADRIVQEALDAEGADTDDMPGEWADD